MDDKQLQWIRDNLDAIKGCWATRWPEPTKTVWDYAVELLAEVERLKGKVGRVGYLERQVDAREEDLKRLRIDHKALGLLLLETCASKTNTEAQLAQAREAIRKWGRHGWVCRRGKYGVGYDCTCGYETDPAVQAATEGEENGR